MPYNTTECLSCDSRVIASPLCHFHQHLLNGFVIVPGVHTLSGTKLLGRSKLRTAGSSSRHTCSISLELVRGQLQPNLLTQLCRTNAGQCKQVQDKCRTVQVLHKHIREGRTRCSISTKRIQNKLTMRCVYCSFISIRCCLSAGCHF